MGGSRRRRREVVAAHPLGLRHRQRQKSVLRGRREAGAEPGASGRGRPQELGRRRRRCRRGCVIDAEGGIHNALWFSVRLAVIDRKK